MEKNGLKKTLHVPKRDSNDNFKGLLIYSEREQGYICYRSQYNRCYFDERRRENGGKLMSDNTKQIQAMRELIAQYAYAIDRLQNEIYRLEKEKKQ